MTNGWGQRGFSLVEIIIVVAVIGILVGIVTVSYGAFVAQSNNTALRADLVKIGDQIKLVALDNQVIPSGGANDSGVGTSTDLPGVVVTPQRDVYDTTVANLLYCAGIDNGDSVFVLLARSISGGQFVFHSERGAEEFSGTTLTTASTGVTLCTELGLESGFTWSLGHTAAPSTWSSWISSP